MKSRIKQNQNNTTDTYSQYYGKIESIKNFVRGNVSDNILPEGTKVKLNYDSIVNEPSYKNKVKAYKNFIEKGKDKVFTVEYDKQKNRHILVCLKEDKQKPKWLFHCEYDLIVLNSDN